MSFKPAKKEFNGIVTNDKFCWSRNANLKLTHWRMSLKMRVSLSTQTSYPSNRDVELCQGGSADEKVEPPLTAVENSPPISGTSRWSASLGSSLSTPPHSKVQS